MAAEVSGREASLAAVRSDDSGRPALLLPWALGLIAVYAAVGVLHLAAPGITQPLDDWWRVRVGVGPDSAVYQWWLPMVFQFLGELGQLLIPLAVIGVLLALRRWRSALFVLAASVTTTLLSQAMKHLVSRPRPADDPAAGLFGPLFSVDHGSFPSGHCVTVATFAIAYAALIPGTRTPLRRLWWAFGALLMVGIVWQRTLINAHWLTDTLSGLVAGAGGALLMCWAFWPLLQRDHERRDWLWNRPEDKTALELEQA